MVLDPWECRASAVIRSSSVTAPVVPLVFEDNFMVDNTGQSPDDLEYVPLDDSNHYLDRLERKLGKLSRPVASSKSLLAGLAACRQLHHNTIFCGPSRSSYNITSGCSNAASTGGTGEFVPRRWGEGSVLNDDRLITVEEEIVGLPRVRGLFILEDNRRLNSVIQRIAPEKLALSAEELVMLLAADSLENATANYFQSTPANNTDDTAANNAHNTAANNAHNIAASNVHNTAASNTDNTIANSRSAKDYDEPSIDADTNYEGSMEVAAANAFGAADIRDTNSVVTDDTVAADHGADATTVTSDDVEEAKDLYFKGEVDFEKHFPSKSD